MVSICEDFFADKMWTDGYIITMKLVFLSFSVDPYFHLWICVSWAWDLIKHSVEQMNRHGPVPMCCKQYALCNFPYGLIEVSVHWCVVCMCAYVWEPGDSSVVWVNELLSSALYVYDSVGGKLSGRGKERRQWGSVSHFCKNTKPYLRELKKCTWMCRNTHWETELCDGGCTCVWLRWGWT